jgi:hypothetical protein
MEERKENNMRTDINLKNESDGWKQTTKIRSSPS